MRCRTTTVCLGFAAKNVSLARPPGWEQESWGYHGDDGDIYSGGNVGKKYKDTTFSAGDVIGCGVNFRTGQAFFTKNGLNLGWFFPISFGVETKPREKVPRFATLRASYTQS